MAAAREREQERPRARHVPQRGGYNRSDPDSRGPHDRKLADCGNGFDSTPESELRDRHRTGDSASGSPEPAAAVAFPDPGSGPRCTSARERRLWLWALAVVVAIYSTLGLAGVLVEELRERDLLGVSFGIGFLLVLAAIAGSALKRRPGRREIWVALGVAAAYGMVVVRMGIGPAERTHLFEYGLVAVLLHEALVERRRNGARVPAPAVLAIAATAILGSADEGIQAVLPNRVFDPRDLGTNVLAGLMAVAASRALSWARRRDLLRRESV